MERVVTGPLMNLKIFNKTNSHYWDKKKTDWAVQDKEGYWWIIPGSEMAETKLTKDKKMKMPPQKRMKQSSMPVSPERMALIILSSILGVSLALNVIYYLVST